MVGLSAGCSRSQCFGLQICGMRKEDFQTVLNWQEIIIYGGNLRKEATSNKLGPFFLDSEGMKTN